MSSNIKRRICIVGAGASGLPTVRHALLYGFDVICYESQDDIGGLWRYKPQETDESSVMKSTVINTSKEMTAFSDFPPPPDDGNFMHNTQLLAYLRSYAEHHGLLKHIRLNTRVLNVKRAEDYSSTGRWRVSVKDLKSGAVTESEFDAVLVCSGHHTTPHWPDKWTGQEKFKGQIIHSHSYKDQKGYEDKIVVVVGIGNSGCDIAVELSRVAKQVYLVSRRGSWIIHRLTGGRPTECINNTRFMSGIRSVLPSGINDFWSRTALNSNFDHKEYGLEPSHSISNAHSTVNDELPNRLASGTVKLKPEIAELSEHGVTFIDGTSVENVDAIVCCTGYSFSFPVVEEGNYIPVSNNSADLYKYIFPLACEHDTLAVIGFVQGNVLPLAEMQARVAMDVFAGRTFLPSQSERVANVKAKKEAMEKRYVKSQRHTIQVDHMPYMDELSQMIGCNPPSWYSCLLTDPELSLNLLFSPACTYFYRLRGPYEWSGAREAVVKIEDRMAKGINSSMSMTVYERHKITLIIIFAIIAFLLKMIVLPFFV